MAYVRGMSLSGDAIDARDAGAALATDDAHIRRFQKAYYAIKGLSPAQQQALFARLRQVVAALPTTSRSQADALVSRTVHLDPRTAPGLGGTGALTTIANVAATIATLGTLGLQVGAFLENRKQTKAQQDAINKQAAAEAALLAQQTAEAKQRMAQNQERFDAEMIALKAQQSGGTTPAAAVGPDGAPAKSNTTPLLLGTGAAAVAAALFLRH